MAFSVSENQSYSLQSKDTGSCHIFLLGMPGCGKTYWAQKISEQLKIDWIDLDAQLEKAAEMSVKEIFETYGEDYFRKKERDVLMQLASFENIIIATGGGTPCFFENVQWMNANGITIWINESADALAERLSKGKAHRPLIKHLSDQEIHTFISNKLAERKPFYSLAQYHLSNEQISLHSFVEIIKRHV